MVRYAPVLFVKVTLYSVDVYGKGTFSYGGLPMFLHRYTIYAAKFESKLETTYRASKTDSLYEL